MPEVFMAKNLVTSTCSMIYLENTDATNAQSMSVDPPATAVDVVTALVTGISMYKCNQCSLVALTGREASLLVVKKMFTDTRD